MKRKAVFAALRATSDECEQAHEDLLAVCLNRYSTQRECDKAFDRAVRARQALDAAILAAVAWHLTPG